MSFKHKAFSAVRWATAAAIARGGLQLAQVGVLSRLLTPEDYGLMAMANVVLSFGAIFSDFGMNAAYMQRENVTLQQRSSLFWMNILISILLFISVVAMGPLLAIFFDDERLIPLLILSATTFILIACGQQVRMNAEKELNFRPVVLLEIATAILGFAVAVLAALAGMGVYALVLGSIISAATSTLFAWLWVARGWRPLWRFSLADIKPYLRSGSAMVGSNIANQINMSMDLLLGGRLMGATQLGLYSVPRNLILHIQFMINPVVTRVGFPLIAKVQNNNMQVRLIYLKTLSMTAATNAPLYIGLAFFAPEVVYILLGDGWGNSVDLLRILAVWGFVRSTINPVGSLLIGMGRADLALKWNVGLLFIFPPALLLGLQFGPQGLAWASLGVIFAVFLPVWFFLVKPLCQAELAEYLIAAFKPTIIAILAIMPAYLLTLEMKNVGFHLLLGIGLAMPTYIAISSKLNPDWISSMWQLAGRKDWHDSKRAYESH